jgi:tetratricopeptide (TPR) repeat protein
LYTLAGNVYRRQARWEEAERMLAKAVELDPRNVNAVGFLADTQVLRRRYPEAIATFERARSLGFDPVMFAVRVGTIDFLASGRTERLRGALSRLPADVEIAGGETPWRILLALIDREYDQAARVLAASPRATFQDVDLSFHYPRAWYEAVIARAAGKQEDARASFEAVLTQFGVRDNRHLPARALAVAAQAAAGVGEKDLATFLGGCATEAMPIERDAYDGPLVLQGMAQVYVWTGEHDAALAIVERLAKLPGYLSYGHLLLDPAWEPVRGSERFQAVLSSLAPR